MRGFFTLLAFIAGLVAPLGPAAAEAVGDSTLRPLLTGNDSRGWEAVGRLNIAGRAMCTGALIAPDLVLTAAHCLYDSASRTRVDPAAIKFLAGWRNGRATAVAQGMRALVPADYVYDPASPAKRVPADIALVKLRQPIRKASITPFQTGARPRKWDRVEVVSYGEGRAQSPSLQDSCHVLARQGGMMIFSCKADFGSSGAPVFAIRNGVAQIVSVISAKGDIGARQVSLGAAVDAPLARLMARLARETAPAGAPTAVRRLTLSRLPRQGGARFVRP